MCKAHSKVTHITFFCCLLLGRFSWTQRIRFACDNCALQIGFMFMLYVYKTAKIFSSPQAPWI